jgi:hypothetical protein
MIPVHNFPSGPPVEAVVNRRVRTVLGWAIPPSATDPQHMDNSTDYASVVDPTGTGQVLRQQRFDCVEFIIVQPKKV